MKTSVSRRSFLQGAGLVAAAGAASAVIGCTPATNSGDAAGQAGDAKNAASSRSWETKPEAITDFADTVEADVVVIGAGLSGMATACSAAQQGLDVVVVEKSANIGPSRTFGGVSSRIMDEAGIKVDRPTAQAHWHNLCASRDDEDLVNRFFDISGEAMNWMLDICEKHGGTVVQLPFNAENSKLYFEYRTQHICTGGEGAEEGASSSNVMLYDECQELGVRFAFESPAVQLIQEADGTVTGCVCETSDGNVAYKASKGVVLAAGDIGGNLEMVEEYCPIVAPLVENGMTIYESPVNTGDGHQMGMWAGGVMQDSPLPPMIHPEIYCKCSPGSSLAVNKEGKRFFNEGTWMQARSLHIMQQTDYEAYWIFDGNWHEGYLKGLEVGGGIWWSGFNDEAAAVEEWEGYIEKGLAWKADTLEELADKMGVDKASFLDSVDRYNGFAETGEDLDYHKDPILMSTYTQPPFYGLKVGASLLVVVGGLKVDLDCRVLTADGETIPNLFAVGNCQGGLFANDYPLVIPACSVGRCLAFGHELGKYLATA